LKGYSLAAGALFKPEVAVADVAAVGMARRGGASAYKFVSVGSQFKKQLSALMASLTTMEPHYVRCIKPNSANSPNLFENVLVLQQLRCGGVLEAVRISCAGYPSRRQFFDFVDHFWHLAPDLVRSDAGDDAITMGIVTHFLDSGYAKGETKIFLKGGQMAVLEKHRTSLLNSSAITIQKNVRGLLQGGQYRRLRKAVVRMQALARMAAAQRLAKKMRFEKATLTAQTAFRQARARRAFFRARAAVLTIQSGYRGRAGRAAAAALKRERAAITVQRYARGAAVRGALHVAHARATVLQCRWRARIARRKLRALRAEARESGKLLQDKNMLEARLKEMQGIVATMSASRADDLNKLKISTERAERAEADAEVLRTQAAKISATEVADLEALSQRLSAENGELHAAAEAAAAATAALQKQVVALQRELTDARDDVATGDEKHKAEVNRLRAERERLKKEGVQLQEDLLQRLQNACSQRDEAREQVCHRSLGRVLSQCLLLVLCICQGPPWQGAVSSPSALILTSSPQGSLIMPVCERGESANSRLVP
jgi:myosin V